MKPMRLNEPRDPQLRCISKVLPDRWLEDQWPLHRTQGRHRPLPTPMVVRVHLLALIKHLNSFNRACRELEHNIDFRRFCRLSPTQSAPSPGHLSTLRERLGLDLWRRLHRHLLGALVQLAPPSPAGLVVLDSTDLPAAVRRTSKKKTSLR